MWHKPVKGNWGPFFHFVKVLTWLSYFPNVSPHFRFALDSYIPHIPIVSELFTRGRSKILPFITQKAVWHTILQRADQWVRPRNNNSSKADVLKWYILWIMYSMYLLISAACECAHSVRGEKQAWTAHLIGTRKCLYATDEARGYARKKNGVLAIPVAVPKCARSSSAADMNNQPQKWAKPSKPMICLSTLLSKKSSRLKQRKPFIQQIQPLKPQNPRVVSFDALSCTIHFTIWKVCWGKATG